LVRDIETGAARRAQKKRRRGVTGRIEESPEKITSEASRAACRREKKGRKTKFEKANGQKTELVKAGLGSQSWCKISFDVA